MYQRTERELARDIRDSNPARAGLARMLRDGLRTWRKVYGDVPLPETKEKPSKPKEKQARKETTRPIDLVEIVTKCVDRYIGFGFHRVVYPDLSEEEAIEKYREDFTIPKDARQPKEYEGRFPIINAVDPRIPLPEKHKRARIKEGINTGNITNQTHIPDKPYIVFTHDGARYLPDTINQATSKFEKDEVAEPMTETTDLYLNHPEFFRNRGRDAAGSRTGFGLVPYLVAFVGSPRVSSVSADDPYQGRGAGSRGKEIIVLGS